MLKLNLDSEDAFIELEVSDVCAMTRDDRRFVESIIRLIEDYRSRQPAPTEGTDTTYDEDDLPI